MEAVSAGLDGAMRQAFARDGVLVLRGFYDVEREILPIQRAIHEIIGLVAQRHGVALARGDFRPECFDAGYERLVAHDRRLGGEVYDGQADSRLPAPGRGREVGSTAQAAA